jgi:hypothetical protein
MPPSLFELRRAPQRARPRHSEATAGRRSSQFVASVLGAPGAPGADGIILASGPAP